MITARLLYAVSARNATGTLLVGAARIEIQRGFVYALAFEQGSVAHPRAEENLRRLLRHAAGIEPPRVRFEEGAPPLHRGRVTPFHPAAALRNHFEAALTLGAGPSLRTRAAREKVRLTLAPHPSCLGFDEKRLITLLGVPRTLAELDDARVATPVRTERLLAFLDAAAAIVLGPSAWEQLGLAEGAPIDEVRRAYKRIARDLHPDLHPGAAENERRDLESRFVALTAAYRSLLPE